MHDWYLWAGFIALVLGLLAVDLFLLNRRSKVISAVQALRWTLVTVVLALAFAGAVYAIYSRALFPTDSRVPGMPHSAVDAVSMYLTGWVVEYSLSLDNLFVILVIFKFFAIPERNQHRVLFWGILGALVLRGVMITAGAALLSAVSWANFVFGGILILTAFRMLLFGDTPIDPGESLPVRLARRFMRLTPDLRGDAFFVRVSQGGRTLLAATPLFLVLIVIETTDVLFAVDSIPAIFAITRDPFLVFTSNVFAIIGLRSLYFALAALIDSFRYLKVSLVFVLMYVGVKMLISREIHVAPWVSLAVIGGALALGILVSVLRPAGAGAPPPGQTPLEDLAEAAEDAWKRTRKWIILAIGVTIVLFGLIVGILPGVPGIPIMIVGLAILATEFIWARRILNQLQKKAMELKEAAARMMGVGGAPTPPAAREEKASRAG